LGYDLIKLHSGIEISNECKITKFIDTWGVNGDGETLIIVDVSEVYLSSLERECLLLGYKKMPFIEKIADNYIYNFIPRHLEHGLYFLKTDPTDSRNYTLIVFNMYSQKFIVYYTVN
jgi:hypothetical protein